MWNFRNARDAGEALEIALRWVAVATASAVLLVSIALAILVGDWRVAPGILLALAVVAVYMWIAERVLGLLIMFNERREHRRWERQQADQTGRVD